MHILSPGQLQRRIQFKPSRLLRQEWAQLGSQIVETTYAIYAAEKQAFDSLRNEVKMCAGQLRRNARIIDELDVTLAFANLAVEMNFCRPQITDE
jgi:DNA mismatch repair ATPase MutS